MSAVKHQPATPLPFTEEDDCILGADGSDAGAPEVSDQNLEYVIHAANAYPKLVQAMRLVANGMVDRNTLCKETSALLRELGEAS